MAITKKDVERVAELARLSINDKDAELYASQLKRILDHVEKLSEVDTSGVEPTIYTVPLVSMTREDIAGESLAIEDVLANAPSEGEGYFKVPKILE
jgi:aspartyl-tRNA(Asn)/glutamyl-tRNA(Gln) amidotransferase subunit C